MSRPTFAFLAAALLMASIAHADMSGKPQSPFAMMLPHDQLHTVFRSQVHRSYKKFTGTFRGRFNNFGKEGTFRGGFKGAVRGKKVKVAFYGKIAGKCDMFGQVGGYKANFSGKQVVIGKGRWARGYMWGRFDFLYRGKLAGKQEYAKAVGNFNGSFKNKKFVLRERAWFNGRIGGKRFKGQYNSVFDGKKFAAAFKGFIDGKRFSFRYEIALENFGQFVTNEGSYTVTSNGKTKTGKFNSGGMPMLPSQ